MNRDPQKNRRSIRLRGYNYSQAGAYFVTMCTLNRECLFGDIVNGKMMWNDAGRKFQVVWNELTTRFPNLELDEFVIMPNHIHGIVVLQRCRGESCIRPMHPNDQLGEHDTTRSLDEHKVRPYGTLPDTLGRVIQAFKSITTHEYINGVKQHGWSPFAGKLWQRNYWEHIIRNEKSYQNISEYIINNPLKWDDDKFYA